MIMLIGTLLEDETELTLFERLYFDHRGLVKSIALRIIDNDAAAEDATQETMLKVARYIKKFKDLDAKQTAALISVIARNCAVSVLREERRQSPPTTAEEPFVSPPCRSLRLAVDALSDELREPLILRYYYVFTTPEIATLLGISLPAAYKRIERAKSALRKMLGEEGL